jgi:hypothetical protein
MTKLFVIATAAAILWLSPATAEGPTDILNVSYDVSRELYADINKAFAAKSSTGSMSGSRTRGAPLASRLAVWLQDAEPPQIDKHRRFEDLFRGQRQLRRARARLDEEIGNAVRQCPDMQAH